MNTPSRILIVEDESLVAHDIWQRLAKLGFNPVGITDSGEKAVIEATALRPDLVLMDIRLKGRMDGIEAAEQLHSRHGIPVVFLTSYADRDTLDRARLSEPFGYLTKPFQERDLHATLEMALYRHRAEQRLRKIERWLTTTLESIGDGVIATDASGRITFLNRMAESLTGWRCHEAIGRTAADVFQLRTKDGNPAPDPVAEVLGRGLVVHSAEDLFLRAREGRVFPVDNLGAPIRDDTGQISGAVVVFRDCSERERLMEEKHRLDRQLQEAQKLEALGVLAGGIAHDFNNLLTAIVAHADLVEKDLPAGSTMRDSLREIQKASFRAADLCKQMLAYAGKGLFVVQNLSLNELVKETVKMLQVCINPNCLFNLKLAENLATVSADATQLRQILMNLVINASEAIGDKGGIISITTGVMRADSAYLSESPHSSDLAEGDYAYLEVADNGCGMSRETMERIFDPFFTTKFMGRGLGLAAVLGIVRGHKGALKLSSEQDRGTTFKLLLPCVAGAPDPIPPEGSSLVAWRGYGTVLVVDDEENVRTAASMMLKNFGFHVLLASDGRDGIEIFRHSRDAISMVLLDLTMPRMDGLATLQELRQVKADVQVLLMSGCNEQDTVSRFMGKGLVGFLFKPFTLEQLRDKVRALLG